MRKLVTSVLEGVGLVTIAAGVAMISAPVGVIVAGCALVFVGYRQAP